MCVCVCVEGGGGGGLLPHRSLMQRPIELFTMTFYSEEIFEWC